MRKIFSFILVSALVVSCSSGSRNDPPGTVYVGTPQKIKGLDPAQASDLYSSEQINMVYEGLLHYHYLKRPYELQPLLAEGMPKVSNGRKTLTFKIKKGVLFQDDEAFKQTQGKGRELTAEDFVYSFKRLADPKVLSTGWWIFDEKIVGLNEWRKKASETGAANYDAEVEGLRALDRYTLQIKLIRPSSQFLYYLAMPFAFAVPKEAVEFYGESFIRNPVGTGPYVYDRKDSNLSSKLVWNKNPTYRQVLYPSEGEPEDKARGLLEDAGKLLPLSNRVVFQVFVESQPRWLNFLSGKLDETVIPKDNFSQAVTPSKNVSDDLKKKGVLLLKRPSLDITHESFNMADPLMGKNKKLRQALSLAHNVEPIIDLFYNGRAIPAQGPIPPGLDGYSPTFKNPYRQYNISEAKKKLAEAGYPGGKGLPEIDYVTLANSTSRQMSDYLSRSFGALGIKLKVSSHTWPEFQEKVKNKKGHMWGFAWSADYPDAENFLQLFYSKNASPGPNDSNYSNPTYDRLYEKALKLNPGAARTSLYKQMVKILTEDCPWIFGVHRVSYKLVHPWLKNSKIHEFENGWAKYYRVDEVEKKKRLQ